MTSRESEPRHEGTHPSREEMEVMAKALVAALCDHLPGCFAVSLQITHVAEQVETLGVISHPDPVVISSVLTWMDTAMCRVKGLPLPGEGGIEA